MKVGDKVYYLHETVEGAQERWRATIWAVRGNVRGRASYDLSFTNGILKEVPVEKVVPRSAIDLLGELADA